MYSQIIEATEGIYLKGLQPNDIIDAQSIGYSRGASVIGLTMNDLVGNSTPPGFVSPPDILQLEHGYYEMTFLDPHPANAGTIGQVSAGGRAAVVSQALGAAWAADVAEIGYAVASLIANDPPEPCRRE